MKKCISLLLLIPLVVLLSACDKSAEGYLTDSICSAPCWQGIAMGTSKDKAVESLYQMSYIDPLSIKVDKTDREDMQYVIYWRFTQTDNLGNIIVNNDVVSALEFSLIKKISLKDAFNLYGNPDYVLIEKQKVDTVYSKVYIIYQQGVCLEYQPSVWPFTDIDTYKIKSNDHIDNIYYADPSIEKWPIRMCNIGFSNENYEKYLSLWKGFAPYAVYQVLS